MAIKMSEIHHKKVNINSVEVVEHKMLETPRANTRFTHVYAGEKSKTLESPA